MRRPYIVCHMMMSLDGRIDCGMTAKIPGVNEYYETLNALKAPTRVQGRMTAELELTDAGLFSAEDRTPYGKSGCSKKAEAEAYCVVVDSGGRLCWDANTLKGVPLVVVTASRVPKAYLRYLNEKEISWIACGEERVDLAAAASCLGEAFGVERMAVVGGGTINGAFLDAGLLDEVSLLVGPAVDGRRGMAAVFDGLAMDREPVPMKLQHVQFYDDGAVWLRYSLRP